MRIITRTLSAALIAVVAVLIVYSFDKRLSGQRGIWPQSPLVGQPAPEMSLKMFDGKTFNLSETKGKVVVLNFWASWCLPCAEEVKDFNKAQKKYGGNVVFIGVNVMDDMEEALEFTAEFKTLYPSGYDESKAVHVNYGVAGVPETFFIGRDGTIKDKISGPATYSRISKAIVSVSGGRN